MFEKKLKCPLRGRKCMGARCAWLAKATKSGEDIPMCGVMMPLLNIKGLHIESEAPCDVTEVMR